MQACYIERYGNADVVQVGELPAPEPGHGELLFRMEAASVNPVDFKTRKGMLRALQSYRMPAILGNDAAGVVTALTHAGIPAVVGMQFRIRDRNAIAFSRAFYRALAAGQSIDAALTDGRFAIFNEGGGFVFNAIHNVQARTPVANIVAMIDAVKEFNAAA